jgi:hypothetical protein
MSTLETINVIVTIVIFLAVALAGGQVIVFNLTAKSTKNLDLHKGITYIGLGAAGYAFVGAKAHFSAEGWVGLVVGVLAIVGVTWMIQKFRRRNDHVIVKKQLSKLTDLNRFVEEHWRYDQQAPQNAK